MSTNRRFERLQVRDPKHDRFARSADVLLGGYTLKTPYFLSLVQSAQESSCLREITQPNAHFGGSVVRIFDGPDLISAVSKIYQTTFDHNIDVGIQEYRQSFPTFVDSATEYLYYGRYMQKWKSLPTMPEPLRKYLARYQSEAKVVQDRQKRLRKHHSEFWNEKVKDHPKLEHALIGYFFDRDLEYRSPIFLPPVPFADAEQDLETAFEINDLAIMDAANRNAQQANYFIIQPRMIQNEHIRRKLLDFVAKSEVRLTVFKFKFLSLKGANPSLVDGFAELFEGLAQIRERHPEKVFVILEAGGEQIFPAATVTFDFVSSSMTGFDFDGRGKAEGRGGLWDYGKKVNLTIGTVTKA